MVVEGALSEGGGVRAPSLSKYCTRSPAGISAMTRKKRRSGLVGIRDDDDDKNRTYLLALFEEM